VIEKKLIIDCGDQKSMIQKIWVVLEIFSIAFQKI
jgi:hypothetical protein